MVVVSRRIGDDVSITSEPDQDSMREKFTTRRIRVGNSETKAALGIQQRAILDLLDPREVWYVTTKRRRMHALKDKRAMPSKIRALVSSHSDCRQMPIL